MRTFEQTDAFRNVGRRSALRPSLWLVAGILGSILWPLLTTAADTPNDVLSRRDLFQRQAAQLRQDFASRIPDEAFIKGPDGSVTGVNRNHPEYQHLQAEYEAGLQKAWNQANQGDGRFSEIDQLCRESGIEQGIKNSGSRPKSINSDLDLTETASGAGKKLADGLKGKGYTVRELPDRWVVQETDTTIWKQQAIEQAGSAAHRAQQAQNATAEDIWFIR